MNYVKRTVGWMAEIAETLKQVFNERDDAFHFCSYISLLINLQWSVDQRIDSDIKREFNSLSAESTASMIAHLIWLAFCK